MDYEDGEKTRTIHYKSGGSSSVFKKRKRKSKQELNNNTIRVDVHNYKYKTVKERCKIILNERQQNELDKGWKLIGKARSSTAVICLDVDAFYAQTLLLKDENKKYKYKPFAVTQKHIVVTCNYPARAQGVKKLQLISEAREICPNLVLRSGEDLTPFRKTSKDIFNATKSFFVHYVNKINAEIANNNNDDDDDDDNKIEVPNCLKSGLDELFIDVSSLTSYIVDNIFMDDGTSNSTNIQSNDNTCHVLNGNVSNHNDRGGSIINYHHQNKMIQIANNIAFQLRAYIYKNIQVECCAGIAQNKIVSKLAVNMHKPNQQTAIYTEAVLPVMLDLPVNNISGIGRIIVKKLNETLNIFHVKDALFEKFSLSFLIGEFGERIGRFLFLAFRGIDEINIVEQEAPKSIAIEDSMLGVTNKKQVHLYLDALSKDLYVRLVEDKILYNRQPTILILKIREKSVGYFGSRITKSARLPIHINHSDHILKIGKSLFDKLILEVSNVENWILTLIGLSCTSFESVGKNNTKSIDTFFSTHNNNNKLKSPLLIANTTSSKPKQKLKHIEASGPVIINNNNNNKTNLRNTNVLPSNIDKSVFDQLPKNIQEEILASSNSSRVGTSPKKNGMINISQRRKKKKKTESIKSYFVKRK